MVSQSKSSTNIALCLTAMLMTASTTQAQMTSTVPERYPIKSDYNKPQEFGRKKRQQRGQQQRKKTNLRKLEGDLSMPLQESEFDMSVPSGPSVRMMSMPLQESEFDLSMPLQESEFDLSMPLQESEFDLSMPLQESEFDLSMPLQESEFDLSMTLQESDFDLSMPMDEVPTLTRGDELEDVVALEESGSSSGGNTLILASFLAGISALVVGAAALFVKMRQRNIRQAEESQMRVVPIASHDDLNDIEEEGREIIII